MRRRWAQSRVGPDASTGVINRLLFRRVDRPVQAGELVLQIQLYAVPSPDLATCGEGNRTGLHQNEIRHTQTVRLRYRRGDFTPDDAYPLHRSVFGFVPLLEFDDGDQLFGAVIVREPLSPRSGLRVISWIVASMSSGEWLRP